MEWIRRHMLDVMTAAAIYAPMIIVLLLVAFGVVPAPRGLRDPADCRRFEVVDPPGVVEMTISRYGLIGCGFWAHLKMEDGSEKVVPVRDIRIRFVEDGK